MCVCVCVCVCVYACVFNNFDWYHNEVPNFWEVVNAKTVMQEVYSEPSQTFKMELFVKIVYGLKPLTIYAEGSILDVRLGFEYSLSSFSIDL